MTMRYLSFALAVWTPSLACVLAMTCTAALSRSMAGVTADACSAHTTASHVRRCGGLVVCIRHRGLRPAGAVHREVVAVEQKRHDLHVVHLAGRLRVMLQVHTPLESLANVTLCVGA